MFGLLCSLIRFVLLPGRVREIALENLALRQQLMVFKRRSPRSRLRDADRLFWLCLSEDLEELAPSLDYRQTGDGSVLASQGLPALLDLALETKT